MVTTPVPPILDVDRYAVYYPVSSTSDFAVGFPLFGDASDLAVFFNGSQLTLGTDYSVLSLSSGSILTPVPVADAFVRLTASISSGKLEVYGKRRPRRTLQATAPYSTRDFNVVISDLWATLRELYSQFTRAIQVPVGETPVAIPDKTTRANQILGFDATGNPVCYTQAAGGAGLPTAGAGDVGKVLQVTGAGSWAWAQNLVTSTILRLGGWTTIASAATVDLGAQVSRNIVITGTTAITSFGTTATADNVPFFVRFAGAMTLTNSGTLILPGGANISTAAGDVALIVWEGAGVWRVIAYTRASGAPVVSQSAPLGAIGGLTISYVSTTTFTVAAGSATSEDGSAVAMVLSGALTKSLSAWSIGAAGGALDTGTIQASKTYHVHLIQRALDGVMDILISLSATAPAMPAAGGTWTARRRIGSLLTNSTSQIVPFTQAGDEFLLLTPVIDASVTTQGATAALYPLSVPTGVQVRAIISVYMDARATNNVGLLISSPDASDVAAGAGTGTPTLPFNAGNAGASPLIVALTVRTDTSGRVRARASGANSNLFQVHTFGWTDMRGRF